MIQHSAGWHIESLELGNLLYYLNQESLGSIEWDSLFQYTRWGNQGKHQILTSVLINTCINMHITHIDTCTLHTLNDTSIHMYTSMHTKVMIKATRKSTAWIPPPPRVSPFHRLSQWNQAGLQWSYTDSSCWVPGLFCVIWYFFTTFYFTRNESQLTSSPSLYCSALLLAFPASNFSVLL